MGVLFPLSRNRTLRPARALLTGALLCSSSVHAQLDTVEIHLDAITVEDGLPQGYVQAMAQDSTGYLWFGTKDGLARYDGYSFTVFRHNEQDTNSIGGDHISSLLVDREGYLWVGYAPFGLDRYDPARAASRMYGSKAWKTASHPGCNRVSAPTGWAGPG